MAALVLGSTLVHGEVDAAELLNQAPGTTSTTAGAQSELSPLVAGADCGESECTTTELTVDPLAGPTGEVVVCRSAVPASPPEGARYHFVDVYNENQLASPVHSIALGTDRHCRFSAHEEAHRVAFDTNNTIYIAYATGLPGAPTGTGIMARRLDGTLVWEIPTTAVDIHHLELSMSGTGELAVARRAPTSHEWTIEFRSPSTGGVLISPGVVGAGAVGSINLVPTMTGVAGLTVNGIFRADRHGVVMQGGFVPNSRGGFTNGDIARASGLADRFECTYGDATIDLDGASTASSWNAGLQRECFGPLTGVFPSGSLVSVARGFFAEVAFRQSAIDGTEVRLTHYAEPFNSSAAVAATTGELVVIGGSPLCTEDCSPIQTLVFDTLSGQITEHAGADLGENAAATTDIVLHHNQLIVPIARPTTQSQNEWVLASLPLPGVGRDYQTVRYYEKIGAEPPVPRLDFVVLGDSYSSGEGNPDFYPGTDIPGVNECHRSDFAFGAVLSNNLRDDIDLLLRACSGALVGDVLYGQWDEESQLDSLSTTTALVTLTVGGNDVGFGPIATICILRRNCHERQDVADQVEGGLANLQDQLPYLYQQIRLRAPSATIRVLGYPRLFPGRPALSCNGFQVKEQRWFNDVESRLNSVIHAAVAEVRASGMREIKYVSTYGAFTGGELCSQDGSYVNPLNLSDTEYTLHPTGAGHLRLEAMLRPTIPANLLAE